MTIDPTDPLASGQTRHRSRRRAIAAATAGVLAVAGLGTAAVWHGGNHTKAPTASPALSRVHRARLDASACTGPTGAAYVADAGWDGFTAVNTKNCSVIQTYNVDDANYNYSSAAQSIAIYRNTLYFADTGDGTIAIIDASKLNPSNYNPPEKIIRVGSNPQDITVTPNGRQVWVADTGPQTDPGWETGVTVLTKTGKRLARIGLRGGPTHVAASPNSKDVYVTTSKGLYVYSTRTRKLAWSVAGLGDPESATVAPNGRTVYVTESARNSVAVLSTATHKVLLTIKVGQMPWQVVFGSKGRSAFVSNPDSNTVSVIRTATRRVAKTWHVAGDPTSLSVTPNGSELWIGQNALGNVKVLSTRTGKSKGTVYLGGKPQYGDGYLPTGIVMSTTPPST